MGNGVSQASTNENSKNTSTRTLPFQVPFLSPLPSIFALISYVGILENVLDTKVLRHSCARASTNQKTQNIKPRGSILLSTHSRERSGSSNSCFPPRYISPVSSPYYCILYIGTDSSIWGSPFAAAERAISETAVTPENEQPLRTYHRPFAHMNHVEVATEINGKEIWLVLEPNNCTELDTHVGGREVHTYPTFEIPDITQYYMHGLEDPIGRELNPRRFLTAADLSHIRGLFTQCIGVRVLICGMVILLFRNRSDRRQAWDDRGPVNTIGFLTVGYAVAEHIGTRAMHLSHAVSKTPDDFSNSVCLGLRLKLPNGQEAVTTVTHGFVELEEQKNKIVLRLTDWFVRLKKSLSRFAPTPTQTDEPGIGTLREPVGNSPLGTTVWLSGTNHRVGKITTTYDPLGPGKLRYPNGFTHDLCLITRNDLPELSSPLGLPIIDGWAEYSDVLDGGAVFATRINVCTGDWRKLEGKGLSREAQRAVIAGVEYIWDKTVCSQTASLLWRTEHISEHAQSFSGSVLCLGKPTDQAVKAVLFQNFETPVPSWHLQEYYQGDSKLKAVPVIIKGGFLLPQEIRGVGNSMSR